MLETTWLTAYAYEKRLRIPISNQLPCGKATPLGHVTAHPLSTPIYRLKHLLLSRKRRPSVHMVSS